MGTPKMFAECVDSGWTREVRDWAGVGWGGVRSGWMVFDDFEDQPESGSVLIW